MVHKSNRFNSLLNENINEDGEAETDDESVEKANEAIEAVVIEGKSESDDEERRPREPSGKEERNKKADGRSTKAGNAPHSDDIEDALLDEELSKSTEERDSLMFVEQL